MMTGKFITFEGCEGSGKSTQIRLLCEYLEKNSIPFISTREPGGSKVAERIRTVILDADNVEMCDECEALLYAAAREQHLKDIVIPALNAGKLVVCDRYIDSSLAYQGAARGLGAGFIKSINSHAMESYPPDLTLFLNISPEAAFSRKHGADMNDRMERQGLDFHMKVYEGYLGLLKSYKRIRPIDCGGTKFETHGKIIALLKSEGIIN
ncbi:MAG: dTMP kinase [Clostridia bacterium]|nr:dTMP kinase [Clostridia bacterium]